MASSDEAAPPPPKKFLNDPTNAVSEVVRGLLAQYPNRLKKLANHNVLLSADIDYNRVNILSGGGSGHEPSHAGWIAGSGMLTGAVLGGVFASPSVSSVLAAIRAVTKVGEGAGCLLVVKNYTGDRLNFGRACELANAEGRKCRMVLVMDDCALQRPSSSIPTNAHARGVAGTVFVHKVAGAAAAQGMDVDQVAALATYVAGRVGTLGVALDAVTVPGASVVNDRLNAQTIEIGLGIHGEAGIRQSPLQTADELAQIMISTILDYGRIEKKDKDGETAVVVPTFSPQQDLIVLVNNLGGTSNFEMSILAHSVVTLLEGPTHQCKVRRLFVGGFMTSFDMQGASLSILTLGADRAAHVLDLLDAPTDAPAWSAADVWKTTDASRPSMAEIAEVEGPQGGETALLPLPPLEDMPNFESVATAMLRAACQALVEAEPVLTKYDVIVGDGDCGITMERGAREVLKRLDDATLKVTHPVTLFSSLAHAVSASMGGTSGVLLELLFFKMSSTLAAFESPITPAAVAKALEHGVQAVSFYGGANVGSRTMLDALVPAYEALLQDANGLRAAADAAQAGADKTASMKSASAGRSNYLNEDALMGTPDPGAVAVATVLDAVAKAMA